MSFFTPRDLAPVRGDLVICSSDRNPRIHFYASEERGVKFNIDDEDPTRLNRIDFDGNWHSEAATMTLGGLYMAATAMTEADIVTKNLFDLSDDTTSALVTMTMGVDATKIDAGWAITLPTAADNVGRMLYIMLDNASGQTGTFTSTKPMGTVDNTTALTVATAKVRMTQFFCDGTTWWYIISS